MKSIPATAGLWKEQGPKNGCLTHLSPNILPWYVLMLKFHLAKSNKMLDPAIKEILEFKTVTSEALGSSEARCSHESQNHRLFLADKKFTLFVSVVTITGIRKPSFAL